MLCTFRRPSMGRPVSHQLMRNELLDLTTILPATACHQRNYVETYSRFNPYGTFTLDLHERLHLEAA